MKFLTKMLLTIFFVGVIYSCGNNSVSTSQPPIKLIVFADKTGSIINNSIPELKNEHVTKLLEYIGKNGGEMTLSSITNVSKENLCTITNIPKPIIKQGETAEEFRNRIREWKRQSVLFSPVDFLSKPDVKKILDYSNLFNWTNISDAVDLANVYLNSNDYFDGNCRKIALFITDGEDNIGNKLPAKFQHEIFMVTRSSSIGSLNKYNPLLHTTVESAINDILKNQQ